MRLTAVEEEYKQARQAIQPGDFALSYGSAFDIGTMSKLGVATTAAATEAAIDRVDRLANCVANLGVVSCVRPELNDDRLTVIDDCMRAGYKFGVAVVQSAVEAAV